MPVGSSDGMGAACFTRLSGTPDDRREIIRTNTANTLPQLHKLCGYSDSDRRSSEYSAIVSYRADAGVEQSLPRHHHLCRAAGVPGVWSVRHSDRHVGRETTTKAIA